MLKKLTNNLGLKILALAFSCILWLVSININDPLSQQSYDVTVQMQNMDLLTDQGKYVEITDNSASVRVNVRAARSVLSSLDSTNIVAIADINKMTEGNLVPIELSVSKTGEKVEKLIPDHDYVSLDVENTKKIQLPILVQVQNEPASEYILGGTSTAQNAVIISGPESIIDRVKNAVVDINVDGATSDVNIVLPIRLYDDNGNEIISSKITKSVSEVTTTASIWYTKTVPVEYEVVGEAREGYEMKGGVKATTTEVLIAGKANILKNINKIEVTEAIDISDVTRTAESLIDIKKYLPTGVSFADSNFDSKVVLTAHIVEKQEDEKED